MKISSNLIICLSTAGLLLPAYLWKDIYLEIGDRAVLFFLVPGLLLFYARRFLSFSLYRAEMRSKVRMEAINKLPRFIKNLLLGKIRAMIPAAIFTLISLFAIAYQILLSGLLDLIYLIILFWGAGILYLFFRTNPLSFSKRRFANATAMTIASVISAIAFTVIIGIINLDHIPRGLEGVNESSSLWTVISDYFEDKKPENASWTAILLYPLYALEATKYWLRIQLEQMHPYIAISTNLILSLDAAAISYPLARASIVHTYFIKAHVDKNFIEIGEISTESRAKSAKNSLHIKITKSFRSFLMMAYMMGILLMAGAVIYSELNDSGTCEDDIVDAMHQPIFNNKSQDYVRFHYSNYGEHLEFKGDAFDELHANVHGIIFDNFCKRSSSYVAKYVKDNERKAEINSECAELTQSSAKFIANAIADAVSEKANEKGEIAGIAGKIVADEEGLAKFCPATGWWPPFSCRNTEEFESVSLKDFYTQNLFNADLRKIVRRAQERNRNKIRKWCETKPGFWGGIK